MTITKQNKVENGMNRNDFFAYKKARMLEMIKAGASISDIAQDLGIEERDVYAFLSRNFGGYRKLKSELFSENVSKKTKNSSKNKSENNVFTFEDVFGKKNKEMTSFYAEIQQNLDKVKKSFFKDFKKEFKKEMTSFLSNM